MHFNSMSVREETALLTITLHAENCSSRWVGMLYLG